MAEQNGFEKWKDTLIKERLNKLIADIQLEIKTADKYLTECEAPLQIKEAYLKGLKTAKEIVERGCENGSN